MTSEDYPDAPDGRDTLKEGEAFQNFVAERLKPHGFVLSFYRDRKAQLLGENPQGVEVKLDKRCLETGRLSIETYEKTKQTNTSWARSGILKQDNSWGYVQGNEQMFWLFSKKWLLRYYAVNSPREYASHGTIKKFYLPLHTANTGSIFMIDCTLPTGKDRIG